MSHEYKFVEGLLKWYFGDQISIVYRYDPQETGVSVAIDHQSMFSYDGFKINTDEIIRYLEELGLKRLDDKI